LLTRTQATPFVGGQPTNMQEDGLLIPIRARVVELADTPDSKSDDRKVMRVRFSPWALFTFIMETQ
jgi:hypothetical protein